MMLRPLQRRLTLLLLLTMLLPPQAFASSFNPTILTNTEAKVTIDDTDTASDIKLQFGDSVAKTLTYERTPARFRFNDKVYVSGNLDVNGTASGTSLYITGTGSYPLLMTKPQTDRIGMGTASPSATLDITRDGIPLIFLEAFNNGGGSTLTLRRARGTSASPSSVNTANTLGGISAQGYGTTAFSGNRGTITFNATEGWTDSAQGTDIRISTTAPGTTTTGERMRITGTGSVGIGTITPHTKLEVVGSVSGSTLTISTLRNCDTIDTDANGVLVCGTDSMGISQSTNDTRYVNIAGDTMTGGLLIQNGNPGTNTIDAGLLLEVAGTASGRILRAQDSLRSSGTLVIAGQSNFEDGLVFGDALNDTVTVNSSTWTFANDTNFVLSGGVNGLSFDTSTLSIDATNHRVGIGTTAPKTKLEVLDTISGAALTVSNLASCSTITASANGTLSCGGMVIKKKTTTQTVNNSTALVEDSNQSFRMGVSETWVYRFSNIVSPASGTPDYRFAVTAPAGSTCNVQVSDVDSAPITTAASGNSRCGQVITGITVAANARETVEVYGTITTDGVAGSGALRWAQGTANTSNSRILSGSTLIAFRTVGSDLAEAYLTKESGIVPGMVVSIDPSVHAGVKRSTKAYDATMLGVVSTKPAMTIGGDDFKDIGAPVFLALAGRVPVMVSAENGAIAVGDFLTSSSTPGVAMKATKAGSVIGQALTSYDGKGVGVVTVFVRGASQAPTVTQPAEDLAQRVSDLERKLKELQQ